MQLWWHLGHLKSNDRLIWWVCLETRCLLTPKHCEEYTGSSIAYLFEQKSTIYIAERVSPGQIVWPRILSGHLLKLKTRMWPTSVSSSVVHKQSFVLLEVCTVSKFAWRVTIFYQNPDICIYK